MLPCPYPALCVDLGNKAVAILVQGSSAFVDQVSGYQTAIQATGGFPSWLSRVLSKLAGGCNRGLARDLS